MPQTKIKKLQLSDVTLIKDLLSKGYSQRQVANYFGVHHSSLQHFIKRSCDSVRTIPALPTLIPRKS